MTLPTQPGLYEHSAYPISIRGTEPYRLDEDGTWWLGEQNATPFIEHTVLNGSRTLRLLISDVAESEEETVTPNPYKDLLAAAVMELEEWIRGERSNWNELHGSVTGDYDNQTVNTALADAAHKNALAAKVNALTALYTKES